MFEAARDGRLKALFIAGTNPAESMPRADRVRAALEACPFVVVADCWHNSTTALADIVLPAAGWGEKDGTVTNSERCISRQRGFLPLPDGVRPDWQILRDVAWALGHRQAFDYDSAADIFREHARLSGHGNNGARVFNIAPLATLSNDEYDQLAPCQWPIVEDESGQRAPTPRLFADGRFPTTDGRARLVPVEYRPAGQQPSAQHPLIVNTGRIRDQWHTMTRTALSARLFSHRSEPYMDVHPSDSATNRLIDGELAELTGPGGGRYLGRVRVSTDQRPGEVFIPIHWNDQFASAGVAANLIAPTVDPVSGQPESKHGVARVQSLTTRWQARFVLPNDSTRAPAINAMDYWSLQGLPHSRAWWLAGCACQDWRAWGQRLFGREPDLVMQDAGRQRYRAAWLRDDKLVGVLLVEPSAALLPELDWLDGCFAAEVLSLDQRRCLLAGRDAGGAAVGPIVCSCFQVGERQILEALENGVDTIDALGDELQCGRNCGSCIPEIRSLIEQAALPADPVAG
ncbi:MAG: hypothetical protein B7X58_03760 [Marinobacter sp. 34-60-7]|nr:MAG: hypothetical protein B7X58_03760 [Marinobacter sp. 34-60-7]